MCVLKAMIAMIILVSLVRDTTGSGNCDSGWTYRFNQCYKAFAASTASTIGSSTQACVNENAVLAMVNSVEENALMLTLLPAGSNGVRIGATDAKKEGVWLWPDGTPQEGWHQWRGGEPNNGWAGAGQEGEDCLLVATTGNWNDAGCGVNYGSNYQYICQKAPISGVSTTLNTIKLRSTGQKLDKTPFATHTVHSATHCSVLCDHQAGCITFNVCKNGDEYQCDLLDADKTDTPVTQANCDNYYVLLRTPPMR